ncbi:uncharacterized protein [Pocillopora verrucosa]|uniref:uncharacterized protein n=1 Tax=Pocillopora verrucosa TaxID=203993 RepID=UPI00333F8ABC
MLQLKVCCSSRFQALCDRLCLYRERSSKLKVCKLNPPFCQDFHEVPQSMQMSLNLSVIKKREETLQKEKDFLSAQCDACDERGNFEGCRYACFLSVADVGLFYRS